MIKIILIVLMSYSNGSSIPVPQIFTSAADCAKAADNIKLNYNSLAVCIDSATGYVAYLRDTR